eukprot:gnl/TRDRNA2_/TRDRNA2_98218_c1_seq1.p1 gnl/TRDRNA2_/TRDRNA2_98218_c1~~gnl/TRDRNA2_/TRDRNA2_98218_c1_seq1.p1  ORF type:complete len:379 (-),score=30.63 gnl/TRDRNA2_/TRDRNA2_98218_c1_seq1:8-1144(-)
MTRFISLASCLCLFAILPSGGAESRGVCTWADEEASSGSIRNGSILLQSKSHVNYHLHANAKEITRTRSSKTDGQIYFEKHTIAPKDDCGASSQHTSPKHVVILTFKPEPASFQATVQNNSYASVCRLQDTALIVLPGRHVGGVETGPHGIPTIRSMYKKAIQLFPNATTYTYANADLMFDATFVATADAIAQAVGSGDLSNNFLVVGRRTNVDWVDGDTLPERNFDMWFSQRFATGVLTSEWSIDWFMVSKTSFDWDHFPAFIPGRRGYDNWIIAEALRLPGVDVVDATLTLRAMHQTNPHIGNNEGMKSNVTENDYNCNLMALVNNSHGDTADAEQYTLNESGHVRLRHRRVSLVQTSYVAKARKCAGGKYDDVWR